MLLSSRSTLWSIDKGELSSGSSFVVNLGLWTGEIINSYLLSRIAIALIWLYHGLIPKLIFCHATEMELIEKGPLLTTPETTLLIAGIAEVLIGMGVLVFWSRMWPIYLSLVGFSMLLLGALAISPEHATHAFNPITLTLSAIFFCLIQISERNRMVER